MRQSTTLNSKYFVSSFGMQLSHVLMFFTVKQVVLL